MRIRKNAKLTPSMIWGTAASPSSPNPPEALLQAHVCVVNRSPWDIPSSPTRDSPCPVFSYQEVGGVGDDSLANNDMNRSLNYDSLLLSAAADDDSRQSVDSMKLSSDCEKSTVKGDSGSFLPPPHPANGGISNGFLHPNKGAIGSPADGFWPLLHLRDQERGGRQEFFRGPPLASTSTRKRNDSKEVAVATGPPRRRRGRPRKSPLLQPPAAAATDSKNLYDFYYYSGFGPRWSKRRSTGGLEKTSYNLVSTAGVKKPASNNSNNKKDRYDSAVAGGGVGASPSSMTCSSSAAAYQIVDDNDLEGVTVYMDEDDSENEDDELGMERQRVRKPVKERSLKSLIT